MDDDRAFVAMRCVSDGKETYNELLVGHLAVRLRHEATFEGLSDRAVIEAINRETERYVGACIEKTRAER